MFSSLHNIRRPAFWLVLTCLASLVFFIATDPRAGLLAYPNTAPSDAAGQTTLGTTVGLAGGSLLLVVSLFLSTRKGSPPTMDAKSPRKP